VNELAGKSTCLAMREHDYQLGRRLSEQSRACPLTVRRGGLSSKEREGKRLVQVIEACGGEENWVLCLNIWGHFTVQA
jgi:hypothetical protein